MLSSRFAKLVFVLMCLVSLSSNSATLTLGASGLLKIPSVQVGSVNYSVELTLLDGVSPISFKLGDNIALTQQTADAEYQNNLLSIPEVIYGADKYAVGLSLIPASSPMQFQLSSASLLCSACGSDSQSTGSQTTDNSTDSIAGQAFNFNELTLGFGETLGTIEFKSDGTFLDDAANASGHFIASGTWTQNGNAVSIHFTFYQYDGQEGVNYDGITLTGSIENNQGSLTDGTTAMNLASLVALFSLF